MKKSVFRGMLLSVMALFLWTFPSLEGWARGADTVMKAGVYVEDISLEGMTAQEAQEAVEAYIASLEPIEITLVAAGGQEVLTTAGELGQPRDPAGSAGPRHQGQHRAAL